jgi:methionyl-tRNA formyltransferase
MMPTFWQMCNGESSATVTVHEMAPDVDKGTVIAEKDVPINAGDSLDSVLKRSKRRAAQMVLDVLSKDPTNWSCVRRISNDEDGTYYSFPEPDDVRNFRARGYDLL